MMRPEDRELVIKDPKCEKVYDMFGAEIPRSDKRKLDIAPTWYIGLDPSCEWLKQCPIDFCFESPFFVRNVSGEPIPLHLLNFGKDGIEYRVELPKTMTDAGWVVEPRDYGYDVVGPLGAKREESQFRVIGRNGGVEKVMYVDIDIITQAYAKSNVEQFDRTFTVDVVNQSATNQVYELRANLPEGWEVSPASQRTKELEPSEIQKLTFTLLKSSAIPATEKVAIPKLEILNVSNPKMEGMVIDYAPIVPRAWTLRRVKKGQIKIDGQPGEWAKDADRYQLPNWMLGPKGDKETSRIYMAYDDDRLAVQDVRPEQLLARGGLPRVPVRLQRRLHAGPEVEPRRPPVLVLPDAAREPRVLRLLAQLRGPEEPGHGQQDGHHARAGHHERAVRRQGQGGRRDRLPHGDLHLQGPDPRLEPEEGRVREDDVHDRGAGPARPARGLLAEPEARRHGGEEAVHVVPRPPRRLVRAIRA